MIFFSDIQDITTMANVFRWNEKWEREKEEMESKIETMTITIYGKRRRTERYTHTRHVYIVGCLASLVSWLMGFLFLKCIRPFGFEDFTFAAKEIFRRWYFKSYSLKLCKSEQNGRRVNERLHAQAHIKSPYIRTRILNQQRKLSEYTSFIYFHSLYSAHHTCSFIHSSFLSILSAHPSFDDSLPSWLLLLLFISSLPFIIGEPESTMINEVLRAVCKLCACFKWYNASQMLFNGWLAGWLGVLRMTA